MERRGFLGVVCAMAASRPLRARAQSAATPVIGYLHSGSPNERKHQVEAFRQGLKETGFIDGKNVFIEYRWAEGQFDLLPGLAKELVSRQVAVIVAIGGLKPGLAAKQATAAIPIVFTGGDDPVKMGLVQSLSHPGGNATGVVNIAAALDPKRFEILRDLLPKLAKVGYLANPSALDLQVRVQSFMNAAGRVQVDLLTAADDDGLTAAFAAAKKRQLDALIVAADPFFITRRMRIVALADRHGVPVTYGFREFPMSGGLMSYGPNLAEVSRQAGVYAGRILKGEKPADLPVLQSEKFELVLNLRTAKKLGLHVSRDFLTRVDQVIE